MNDDVAMMGPAWWPLLNLARQLVEREGLQLDADTHAEAVALVMLDAVAPLLPPLAVAKGAPVSEGRG